MENTNPSTNQTPECNDSPTIFDVLGSAMKTETLSEEQFSQPVCMIIIGMAGSGKTRFVQKLSSFLHSKEKSHRIINLDPAVENIPFLPYIDIRDAINYKEVMKKYGLGPNGGIVTSLNLYTIMFSDVLEDIIKKQADIEYILFDTPGQIEVFHWSASGTIICDSIASRFPTIIVHVVDTVRSVGLQTFMSNMLYACSILCKYKLPFIIAMNKIDILSCQYALDWMSDFEKFQAAIDAEHSYANNLTRSLSWRLDEFYNIIKTCGVSAATGEGMEEFMEKIATLTIEYEEYREEYNKLLLKRKSEKGLPIGRRLDIELVPKLDSESSEEEIEQDDVAIKREEESYRLFMEKHRNKKK